MENRSKQIEESKDELLQLVRHHVEDVLHKYYPKHGYDVRDDAVLYVYELARKKGTHDSNFQQNKDTYIKNMVGNYLVKKLFG